MTTSEKLLAIAKKLNTSRHSRERKALLEIAADLQGTKAPAKKPAAKKAPAKKAATSK